MWVNCCGRDRKWHVALIWSSLTFKVIKFFFNLRYLKLIKCLPKSSVICSTGTPTKDPEFPNSWYCGVFFFLSQLLLQVKSSWPPLQQKGKPILDYFQSSMVQTFFSVSQQFLFLPVWNNNWLTQLHSLVSPERNCIQLTQIIICRVRHWLTCWGGGDSKNEANHWSHMCCFIAHR